MWRVSDVLYLGLVNWLATVILTSSSLFAPLRAAAAQVHPKLGELTTCPLCAGTWVGFAEGFLVGGPLRNAFWNGLLYKSIAELVQICAIAITLAGQGAFVASHNHHVDGKEDATGVHARA